MLVVKTKNSTPFPSSTFTIICAPHLHHFNSDLRSVIDDKIINAMTNNTHARQRTISVTTTTTIQMRWTMCAGVEELLSRSLEAQNQKPSPIIPARTSANVAYSVRTHVGRRRGVFFDIAPASQNVPIIFYACP